MFLTIQTLFDDANIVSAIIRRVNQTRKDTIYWQQYLTFRRVTTRVFKDYIGSEPELWPAPSIRVLRETHP